MSRIRSRSASWNGAVQRGLHDARGPARRGVDARTRGSGGSCFAIRSACCTKAARRAARRREAPFPDSERARLHQPLRLRRFDPVSTAPRRASRGGLRAQHAPRGSPNAPRAARGHHDTPAARRISAISAGRAGHVLRLGRLDCLTAAPPLVAVLSPGLRSAGGERAGRMRRVGAALEAIDPIRTHRGRAERD